VRSCIPGLARRALQVGLQLGRLRPRAQVAKVPGRQGAEANLGLDIGMDVLGHGTTP
jgi:hypothetical protein